MGKLSGSESISASQQLIHSTPSFHIGHRVWSVYVPYKFISSLNMAIDVCTSRDRLNRKLVVEI